MFLHRFAFHRESFWTNILRKKKVYCTDLQRYVSPMKDNGEKIFRTWIPERQVKKCFEFEESSSFRYLTEANFCSSDISRSLSLWFYMHIVWDLCTLQGGFKLYSLLVQNPTCLQMFETLNVLKMFAESYLVSFMPDEEYNIFLEQKPAVNCQENLITRGISLAVLKKQ